MIEGAGVVRSARSLAGASIVVAEVGAALGAAGPPPPSGRGARQSGGRRPCPVGRRRSPHRDARRACPERLPRHRRGVAPPAGAFWRYGRRSDRIGCCRPGLMLTRNDGVDRQVTDQRTEGGAGVVDPPRPAVREAVGRALAEDLLPVGDLTASLVGTEVTGTVAVVSRQPGVVAGRCCAEETFSRSIRPRRRLAPARRVRGLTPGSVLAAVSGRLRSILTAERTALNFLCHLSGVATITRRFVDAAGRGQPPHPHPRHPQDDPGTALLGEGGGARRRGGRTTGATCPRRC